MDRKNYKPLQELEKTRRFFNKMVNNGFVSLAETIDEHQVRCMLDPVEIDVVTSADFRLKEIDIAAVKPTGYRWVECSRSLGPIIVDVNPLGIEEWGLLTVIEGKHRWLDAQERGEKTIWAWVGDEALKLMKEVLYEDRSIFRQL